MRISGWSSDVCSSDLGRVKDLTDGKGVPVVYDSVGKDTFDGSLDCLKPRGMMVLFGAASGPAPAVDPNVLNTKGSLYPTRPSIMAYNKERPELEACAAALFDVVTSGRSEEHTSYIQSLMRSLSSVLCLKQKT